MPDVQITTYEGSVVGPAATIGSVVTVFSGTFPGPRFVLLDAGVTTPPAGTPTGSLIFQKGA